jgi:acetolactate synthase-1/2/3 large subunit
MSGRRSGGEALVDQLEREGVRHVFSVPGQQLDHAVDAFAKARERIAFIANRHEQGSAYMADGYARASGKAGVCMVVPGPGLLNAMAGLATAYSCSSPVLCIVGQIPSAMIGRGLGVLHEIPNQSQLLDSVTKWRRLARTPEEIPALVREAFRQLRSGRPRPVAIEIPPDVLAASADTAAIEPPDGEELRTAPDAALVDAAAKLLAAARRPVIYVGGGLPAADGSAELKAVAEALQAPVIMSRSGRGALSDRHELALTRLSGRKVLPEADVVLVVGSRFMGFGGKPVAVAAETKVVMVDVDETSFGPPRSPILAITADAKLFLAALGRSISGPAHRGANEAWGAEIAERARQWAAEQLKPIEPQMAYLRALRAALPDDAMVATDLTQVAYPARVAFPFYAPRTNLTSGYQGTLGFGFPLALGAKVARPDRVSATLSGDGGFLWNVQELATARQYGIAAIAIVFNDNGYGNVRRTQLEDFQGRVVGTDLHNPDFVALAESFGVRGRRAHSPEELGVAIGDAIAAGGPALIEAPIGDVPSPWRLIG